MTKEDWKANKLQTRWSYIPYTVVGKKPNQPVYKVKPEAAKKINREHILPIGQLVRLPWTEVGDESPITPKTQAQTSKRRKPNPTEVQIISQESPDLDSSSDFEYCRPNRFWYTCSGNMGQATRSAVEPLAFFFFRSGTEWLSTTKWQTGGL